FVANRVSTERQQALETMIRRLSEQARTSSSQNRVTTFSASDELVSFAAILNGQYEIEREIGRGGMGVVYLARDLRLDRMVAIKTLPPGLAVDAGMRDRFLREARTVARL